MIQLAVSKARQEMLGFLYICRAIFSYAVDKGTSVSIFSNCIETKAMRSSLSHANIFAMNK